MHVGPDLRPAGEGRVRGRAIRSDRHERQEAAPHRWSGGIAKQLRCRPKEDLRILLDRRRVLEDIDLQTDCDSGSIRNRLIRAANGAQNGRRHRKPGKRAKSPSVVIHSHPDSTAIAASHASWTRLPVTAAARHRCSKIAK